MSITHLSAQEIAEEQLKDALNMWQQGRFLAAITLAGAADEILGKRLRKIGKEPAFDNLKKAVMDLAMSVGETAPNIEKIVSELLNQTRNELKHYSGDEALGFDLREDAIELIDRAICNYSQLTGNVLPEMLEFWGGCERNI